MRARDVGAPDGHDGNAQALCGFSDEDLAATRRRHGHVVFASRQDVRAIVPSAHADELLYFVVIRRDVGVADGPRNAPAVALRGAEIDIRHPQADAAPDVGLAADAPDAHEVERLALRGQIGLLGFIEKKGRRLLAVSQTLIRFEGYGVRPKLGALEFAPGVEHEHFYALLRQVVGRHPAGSPAADDDDVVNFTALYDLHRRPLAAR